MHSLLGHIGHIGYNYNILYMYVLHYMMTPTSKACSNTFLQRSFIYAAPGEWNKLSEYFRTSSFDSFRKSVKTMLFTQQYYCFYTILCYLDRIDTN